MRKHILFWTMGLFLSAGLLISCSKSAPAAADPATAPEETKQETEPESKPDPKELARGEVRLEKSALEDYAVDPLLLYDDGSKQMVYTVNLPQIPQSDDEKLYLFLRESYEEKTPLSGRPAASCLKGRSCRIKLAYREGDLFGCFVPALLIDGAYVPAGRGVYLSNPEALAKNTRPYPEPGSKKGLLLDPTMLGTTELTELGVKHSIYNIPLSSLMGETTDPDYPTVYYTYKGTRYAFNGKTVTAYDNLFRYLTDLGTCATAIVLNDWNETFPEMIHPDAADGEGKAYYFMFNTAQPKGVRELEAVASFLTQRYSGGEHGMVYNWVIANEINQKVWNYMDTEDLSYYVGEFEKAFRIFYQAAKSAYQNAGVYFSVDHAWNCNQGDNSKYFNARDLVEAFNERAVRHGNYDWGLAIHPYPDPLSRVNYWSQTYDKTQDAPVLSIMNLCVVTDLLKQESYRDTRGEVRSITVTELGFSSESGEKLQAAAFAYGYLIVDANPYIEAFFLNRQTDAPEEVMQGLAFGIYEYDHTEKYIKDVFCKIDTDQADAYLDSMLNILKADSLQEALSWAA